MMDAVLRQGHFLAGFILIAHLGLSLHAAWNLSPTWDEIAYPAAGLTQWRTRTILFNPAHPFLGKLLAAFPLLFLKPTLPTDTPAWKHRDGYRVGFAFTFHNRVPARTLLFWSRVPAAVCSALTGLLLYLWMSSLWGSPWGLISMLCYVSTPILLSRACLGHLEAPMYLFTVLALWLHARWSERPRDLFLYAAGAAMGLAFLCKLTALPLLPTFVILEFAAYRNQGVVTGLRTIAKLLAAACLVVFLFYLPWHGAWAAFKEAILNLLSFPAGQVYRFRLYFWHGQLFDHPSAWISWAAWLIKAPLLVLALGIWGAWSWARSQRNSSAGLHLGIFAGACFFSVLYLGSGVSSVQFSPIYLAVAGLAAGLAAMRWNRTVTLVSGCLLLALGDAYCIHPNYLAYFNVLVGGSQKGWQWLADSDQDWGQALPALADYQAKTGNPDLLLAYSGAGDPRAYGLRYQDLFSPALVSQESQGERMDQKDHIMRLAIATKVLQSEPESFAWLTTHLTPLTRVSNCFFIYDITKQPEAYRWIAMLYLQTRRPRLARWALERAACLT